jgi:hypothetical protein
MSKRTREMSEETKEALHGNRGKADTDKPKKKEAKRERKPDSGSEGQEAGKRGKQFESLPGWEAARKRRESKKIEPRNEGEKLKHTEYGLTVGGAKKRHVVVPKLTSVLHTGGRGKRNFDLGAIKGNG